MSFSTFRPGLVSAAALLMCLSSGQADAQCATCPQPTVVASPVVQPAPVVYQANRPYSGWYPCKCLVDLFRPKQQFAPVAAAPAPAPTFVTASYRPTYPPTYTVGYAPMVQTVARPVALSAYAAQPAAACCNTSYRPVTLTTYDPCGCTPTCATGSCCGSSGVATAGYDQPYNPGCSSCAGSSMPATQAEPNYGGYDNGGGYGNGGAAGGSMEPTPAISPNDGVPENRVMRPESPPEQPAGESSLIPANEEGASGAENATSWWEQPELFDPRDRSAQRPTAPVWNAVYSRPSQPTAQRAAYRPAPQTEKRNVQSGASGWRAAH